MSQKEIEELEDRQEEIFQKILRLRSASKPKGETTSNEIAELMFDYLKIDVQLVDKRRKQKHEN